MSSVSGSLLFQIANAAKHAGYERPADVPWKEVKKLTWLGRLFKKLYACQACQACQWRDKVEWERVTFTWNTGAETLLLMFQCPRCKTIFYQEEMG